MIALAQFGGVKNFHCAYRQAESKPGPEICPEDHRAASVFATPECERLLEGADLAIAGRGAEAFGRAVELRSHRFFSGAPFQPERSGLRETTLP